MSLSPPPVRDKLPVSKDNSGNVTAEMSRAWLKWFTEIKDFLSPADSSGGTSGSTSTSGISWSAISKLGSNLTDLVTRKHQDLQELNTAQYTHLTQLNATDLTDGGETILHKHNHNLQNNLQGGTINEYYHETAHQNALVGIIDTQWSTGIVGTGLLVTDGGSGTVNIAGCNILLRATNSDTANIVEYTVSAVTGLALTDLQNNYIYAQYNSGVPNYIATITERTDTNTNVLIARVYRGGTAVHINNYAMVRANDNLRRVSLRFVKTEPIGYVSGGMLAGVGTRNISITAGQFWACTNPITTNAFNSSTGGTFTYEYQDGIGGWVQQTGQTQINNSQYDNGSGTLQNLTANRYAVGWVYMEVDNDVIVLYGQGDYTLAQANAAASPGSVPPRITAQGFLVGKIILQQGSASFLSVESAFIESLATTIVNDHEQLAGLLGGAANDHYHLTGTQATDLTDGGETTLHKHDQDHITYPATSIIGTVANTDLHHLFGDVWSAGATDGFAFTDNGNGTAAIAAGVSALRVSASENALLNICEVAATNPVSFTDSSLNYIYVNYNAGTPVVQVGTSLTDFNCLDKCILYTVSREGNTLYWVDARNQNVDFNRKHRRMLLECEGFRHVNGGCILSATGTRNIAVTAGDFYYGLAKVSHSAFDTSAASTFKYYYRNGTGGWTTSLGNTQIDNLQYDNGTGTLATLSNNKFGVFWIYLILDNPTILAVQYGQGDYANLADAKVSTAPTAPPSMQGVGVLVGRIIIEKSATVFSDVGSAFTEMFAASAATLHNGLSGLQGGTTNEYYHLTSAEYAALTNSNNFAENNQTISASYTLAAGKNASTVGPITVSAGVVMTISAGSRLVVF